MIAQETARTALEALWQAMVELAEASNDHVIGAQASGNAADATEVAAIASDLAIVAHAAAVLARRGATASP